MNVDCVYFKPKFIGLNAFLKNAFFVPRWNDGENKINWIVLTLLGAFQNATAFRVKRNEKTSVNY